MKLVGLTKLVSQRAPRIHLSAPRAGALDKCHPTLCFYVGVEDPNRGPYVCTAGTVPTKPSSLPLILLFGFGVLNAFPCLAILVTPLQITLFIFLGMGGCVLKYHSINTEVGG